MIKLFNQYFRVPFLILAGVEFSLATLAVYLGYVLRTSMNDWDGGVLSPMAVVVVSSSLIFSMLAMGLYQSRSREGYEGVIVRLGASYAAALILISLFFYIFPFVHLGRGVLGLALITSFFSMLIVRFIFMKTVDEQALKRRVLVLGAGERAAFIFQRIRRKSDQRGFFIVGYVPVSEQVQRIPGEYTLLVEGGLRDFVINNQIDEVVVAIDDMRQNFPADALLDLKLTGTVDVVDVVTFFEREMGKIETRMLYPGWLIFSEGFARGAIRSLIERMFDLASSFLILMLTWPVMLLTMLAIKLEEGKDAPLFYKQTRVGFNGRLFDVLKFRSMRQDAEKHGAVWAQQNDPRVTKVGAFIRKYRIDELPQVVNVFVGEMAFVGPRPERPEFVKDLSEKIPYFSERHRVKPGITGWAQLCYPYGASDEDAEQKLQYDLYYVKNHNLLLDLIILIQTVEVVLFGRGR